MPLFDLFIKNIKKNHERSRDMSSISSIHVQSSAFSSCKGEELSVTTKMRLEALGIDPSSVTSEAQAQIIIAQAEASQRQNNSGKQQGGNTSQQQLIFEAKELARKTGTFVSEQDTLDDMLDKISKKLNSLAQNPQNAEKVQSYQSELLSLAQRANVAVQIQENIFNTMDMISVSNKLILGL